MPCTWATVSFVTLTTINNDVPLKYNGTQAYENRISGISLTVADVLANKFVVWIIPYTKRHTNLNYVHAGDVVNLEFDILAKYVERMLQQTTRSGRVRKTNGGFRTTVTP